MTAREVILEGGAPWGFRMHGGVDVNQPLRISRVNPGSKAAACGIREGDTITTINGETTRNRTNSDAHTLLKSAGNRLKLGLNQDNAGNTSRRRQYIPNGNGNIQHETTTETIKRSNVITKYLTGSSSTATTSTSSTTTKLRKDPPHISIEKSTNSFSPNSEDKVNVSIVILCKKLQKFSFGPAELASLEEKNW